MPGSYNVEAWMWIILSKKMEAFLQARHFTPTVVLRKLWENAAEESWQCIPLRAARIDQNNTQPWDMLHDE